MDLDEASRKEASVHTRIVNVNVAVNVNDSTHGTSTGTGTSTFLPISL